MPNKIRVLIVDDNDETRNGTRRLLEYEDDIEIIDFAENGQIAIEKVKDLDPDVVLMDINMPVMDGITATQRLQVEAPRSQVIIVSVQDDANYMRQAIRAGAVDFVAKPIGADEIAESIRRAHNKRPAPSTTPAAGHAAAQAPVLPGYERPLPRREGQVITVLGPKGGVGKTTVAVNLGVALARANPDKKVLIVDASLYFGDVAVFLNTRGQYNVIDMAAMAEVPEDIDTQTADSILVPHESGVRLLIAPSSPGTVSLISLTLMTGMVRYLKTQFDYVVIDTSTSFDDVLAGAVQAADRLVMVTVPTMPSLKDTKLMFTELAAAGYHMESIILVLNMVDKNTRITTEQISNFLRCKVALTIPVDPNANEALNRGIALVTLDPRRSAAVRPLSELASLVRGSFEEVVEEVMPVEPERRRGGLFGAFRGG